MSIAPSRKLQIVLAGALASLALLIPSGSANAATAQRVAFCGTTDGFNYRPMTLKPGQACTFWPVAVHSIIADWVIVHRVGYGGGICVGVIQYPPGWPKGQPLSPTGSGPGNYWSCSAPYSDGGLVGWYANNGFGAVYGEPVMLNYTSSTIQTQPASGPYGWLYYYS